MPYMRGAFGSRNLAITSEGDQPHWSPSSPLPVRVAPDADAPSEAYAAGGSAAAISRYCPTPKRSVSGSRAM